MNVWTLGINYYLLWMEIGELEMIFNSFIYLSTIAFYMTLLKSIREVIDSLEMTP